MPTHSDISAHTQVSATSNAPTRPTCPPESDRITSWIESAEGRINPVVDNGSLTAQSPPTTAGERPDSDSAMTTDEALSPQRREQEQQSQGPEPVPATGDDSTSNDAAATMHSPGTGNNGAAGSGIVESLATAEEVRSPVSDSTAITDDYDETDEPMTPTTSVSAATEIKDEQREPAAAAAAATPAIPDIQATHRTSMSFEYSHARVSHVSLEFTNTSDGLWEYTNVLTHDYLASSCQTTPPRTSEGAAGLPALNSLSSRFTPSTWRSRTLTCPSPISADTSKLKVRHYLPLQLTVLLCTSVASY